MAAQEKLTEIFNQEFFHATEYFDLLQKDMNLSGLELILSPSVGVELPFLVSVEIVPEIELKWSRIE